MKITTGQDTWNSDLIAINQSGRLEYFSDSTGNQISDFSYAGYRNGTESIPDVPVVLEISPVAGDNTSHIQTAIDAVEAMTQNAEGIRGALLLTAGQYEVSGILQIDASGVVLRGVGDGSDTTSNTVIFATGNSPSNRTIIKVGSGDVELWGNNLPQPQIDIISDTVKAGERRFQIADPSLVNVGDNIIIIHPCTEAWLASIDYGGTHTGGGSWEPGVDEPWAVNSQPIYYNRNIVAIDGNTVTIDAPVFNILIRSLSQAYIYVWDGDGLVRNVGIENLRVDIENTGGADENHAENGIVLYGVEDAWIRNCTVLHFIEAGFETGMATRVTIDSCNALDPVSIIEVFFSFFRKLVKKKSPLHPDSKHLHMLLYKKLLKKNKLAVIFDKEIEIPRIKDKASLKKTVKLFATCAYNNSTDKILINIIKIIGPEPE